jgi:8-oxo-dGTP pyrophosphatase MutT (NUDIX family)
MRRRVAVLPGVRFADGSVADVELVVSERLAPEVEIFAAMVVVEDDLRRYAVVYSPRRQEWGAPGGWREPGETALECAVREVREETGLELDPEDLTVWGYERFAAISGGGRWPEGGGCLQVYRTRLDGPAAELVTSEADAQAPRWVDGRGFAQLCGDRFWWPLLADLVHPADPPVQGRTSAAG